jgi:ATP-dependent Clp protease, protease subunit
MTADAPRWYAFRSSDDEAPSAEVHLYDDIGMGGASAKDFIKELKAFGGQHLTLRINSSGGSVVEGNAIYNALKRHKGGVTAYVDSLAASMASVIAMAADEVVMAENALMFVHNPWTLSIGDAEDLRKEAAVLDKIKANIVSAYSRKTGLSRSEVSELMDADTWLDSAEAVRLGFADDYEKPNEAAASIKPEELRARVANFMAKTNTPPAPPAVDTNEEAMNAELQAKVDELQAALALAEESKNIVATENSQALAAQSAEVESLKGEVERLTNEVATRDAEIADLKAAQKSAGEQAAAIVAGMGIDPAAQGKADEPTETAAQKFAKLDGAEAVAFFRANRREILATSSIS